MRSPSHSTYKCWVHELQQQKSFIFKKEKNHHPFSVLFFLPLSHSHWLGLIGRQAIVLILLFQEIKLNSLIKFNILSPLFFFPLSSSLLSFLYLSLFFIFLLDHYCSEYRPHD